MAACLSWTAVENLPVLPTSAVIRSLSFRPSRKTPIHCCSTCHWPPTPHLHPVVYGQQTCPLRARAWGLAQCGHHDFSDGRSARHGHADPLTPCRFCAVGMNSLEHALLNCSAHQSARQRWMQQSGGTALLSLRRLISHIISHNIAYVAHVCQAAAAFEF